MGTERQVAVARELAFKVKRALRDQVGECLTCSIGIAPNVFLGKVGSDLQKPDGLVVITKDDLPDILLGLYLQDIYGIGRRMEQRLHRAGILTVAQLWNATPFQLRRVFQRSPHHAAGFRRCVHFGKCACKRQLVPSRTSAGLSGVVAKTTSGVRASRARFGQLADQRIALRYR